MKVMKTAEQQNFIIDRWFYTEKQLSDMYSNMEVNYLAGEYRIFAKDCKMIKVVYHEGAGAYINIVVGNNDKNYVIKLN